MRSKRAREADPADVLARGVAKLFHEYLRAVIGKATRTAMQSKRSRGESTGTAPYGFKLAGDGVHLEPNGDEHAVIARARELRASGMSLRAVSAALARLGHLSRVGKPFQPGAVNQMVAGNHGRPAGGEGQALMNRSCCAGSARATQEPSTATTPFRSR